MNNPFDVIEARLNNIETLLLDLKHNSKEPNECPKQDQLLTVPQAAEFLTLSVPTVYGLISKGAIPCMKRSKRVYFSRDELITYLKQGKKQTVSELATETDQYLSKKKEVRNA